MPLDNSTACMEFFIQSYRNLDSIPEYHAEIVYIRDLLESGFEKCTPEKFFEQYVWCVLNAGMKEQIARKIWERYLTTLDPLTVGHLGKRKAVEQGLKEYVKWFGELKCSKNPIEYLQTLPWIGPITKYHLARNIGIDTVKPDRHLERFATRFGFKTPLELCRYVQNELETDEKLGLIDLVFWRSANLGWA